eukprot:scaffold215341_cov30-Tisochrysis_lutea.AAC.8
MATGEIEARENSFSAQSDDELVPSSPCSEADLPSALIAALTVSSSISSGDKKKNSGGIPTRLLSPQACSTPPMSVLALAHATFMCGACSCATASSSK